jgi:tetratricopeptide (TPR) repeat protein
VEQPPEYKPTLFDRHGPDAFVLLAAAGHGVLVAGMTAMVLGLYGMLNPVTLVVSIAAGFATFAAGVRGAQAVELTIRRIALDGTSTPYKEQYSREQALVMQGRVDDALASFEAIIDADPAATTPRIRAAELYARERGNAERAAELLRQVQRAELCSAGEHVYVAHRLVDLYTGPLNDPGRALVELRRLIERFPNHPAAAQARDALAVLKARHQTAVD